MARRHGFTIAETLVALLVFSLVLSILSLVATNLTRYYQSSQNQQREAQVARAIMSLEVPDTRLTLTECFKRQLVLYSKTRDTKYYLDVRHKALGLYTRQGGNMKYINQVKRVNFVQLSRQRVQAMIEFEEGTTVTQEITFYEGAAGEFISPHVDDDATFLEWVYGLGDGTNSATASTSFGDYELDEATRSVAFLDGKPGSPCRATKYDKLSGGD